MGLKQTTNRVAKAYRKHYSYTLCTWNIYAEGSSYEFSLYPNMRQWTIGCQLRANICLILILKKKTKNKTELIDGLWWIVYTPKVQRAWLMPCFTCPMHTWFYHLPYQIYNHCLSFILNQLSFQAPAVYSSIQWNIHFQVRINLSFIKKSASHHEAFFFKTITSLA